MKRLYDKDMDALYRKAEWGNNQMWTNSKQESIAASNLIIVELLQRLLEGEFTK